MKRLMIALLAFLFLGTHALPVFSFQAQTHSISRERESCAHILCEKLPENLWSCRVVDTDMQVAAASRLPNTFASFGHDAIECQGKIFSAQTNGAGSSSHSS
jgi:hypothetical protein